MHRFWSSVVTPLLELADARTVIEIGAADGRHTRPLAEFCRKRGGALHVIEPSPLFPRQWEDVEGDAMTVHRGRSVDVLPGLPPADAVLIDGDHNWHTVTRELDLIAGRSRATSAFPLVVLHDTEWPYARRDMYYDPATVPEEGRHPYARGGVLQECGTVLENRGLNPHFFHAAAEGGPRNGVRTAIEDFLARETAIRACFLPGLHGLCVLHTAHTPASVTAFLASLTPSSEALLRAIDDSRNDAELRCAAAHLDNHALREQVSTLRAELLQSEGLREALRTVQATLCRVSAEARMLRDERERILHSWSWKLTSLLRRCGAWLRAIRPVRPSSARPAW